MVDSIALSNAEGGLHKLLQRQLRRVYGDEVPDVCAPFVDAVNEAYHRADLERNLLERSLDLTSEELRERNDHLRAELRERERTEEALRRSMVRLDEAQRHARVGYWEVDTGSGVIFWSDETYRIFGHAPGAVTPTWSLVHERFPPDDLQAIFELVETAPPREPRNLEVRILRADGERRVLRASGEVVREADGRITHVFGICVDVTEQKRHEEALEQAREQAEAARLRAEEMLRLKSALLNNMSHEIRTPLTGILGFSEVLAEEVGPEQRDFARLIHNSARRLLDTLNSVLDLAQIESGTMALSVRAVDAGAEVEGVAALLRPLAEQKGVALRTEFAGPAFAFADAAALHRILTNLVGNAIKFTKKGEVVIALRRFGDEVRLAVRDTGPGISKEFLPHLFDEFKQESTGLDRAHEGSGLGLAITRRLTEMMGGTITVESTPGAGTQFELRLPAYEAARSEGVAESDSV